MCKSTKTSLAQDRFLNLFRPRLVTDYRPATSALITWAESQLDRALPVLYIELVKRRNGGRFKPCSMQPRGRTRKRKADVLVPYEIMGLHRSDPSGLVGFTLDRHSMGLPSNYLVLDSTGHEHLCLEYRRSNETEPRVIWVNEDAEDSLYVARSFADFMERIQVDPDYEEPTLQVRLTDFNAAVLQGDTRLIRSMLEHGLDANKRPHGPGTCSALDMIVSTGQTTLFDMVCEYQTPRPSRNAIQLCLRRGHVGIARRLRDYWTPSTRNLADAVFSRNASLVNELLDRGVRPTSRIVRDAAGLVTGQPRPSFKKHPGILKLLLDAGGQLPRGQIYA